MWRNPVLGDKCLLGPLGLMIAQRHLALLPEAMQLSRGWPAWVQTGWLSEPSWWAVRLCVIVG